MIAVAGTPLSTCVYGGALTVGGTATDSATGITASAGATAGSDYYLDIRVSTVE